MRQPLFKAFGFEVWRYQWTGEPPKRMESQRWAFRRHDDLDTLHKIFLRLGPWVYAVSWFTNGYQDGRGIRPASPH